MTKFCERRPFLEFLSLSYSSRPVEPRRSLKKSMYSIQYSSSLREPSSGGRSSHFIKQSSFCSTKNPDNSENFFLCFQCMSNQNYYRAYNNILIFFWKILDKSPLKTKTRRHTVLKRAQSRPFSEERKVFRQHSPPKIYSNEVDCHTNSVRLHMF